MIERLYVHNYRCLENFTLDLKGQGSALLLGKNGSGKSAVRQSLAILRNIGSAPARVRDLIDITDVTQGRIHEPMRFELDIVLSVLGQKMRFSYSIAFRVTNTDFTPQVFQESLTIDGNLVFGRQSDVIELPGQQPAFQFNPDLAALSVIPWGPDPIRVVVFCGYLKTMILLAPTPSLMTGYADQTGVALQENGDNISAVLNALLNRQPSAYRKIEDYLRTVMPDFDSIENIPHGERGTQLLVRFRHPDTESLLAVEFKKLSDGEKCFFLAALVLVHNQSIGPVFCFWDEPDNHLSLPEVSHFITELRRMANRGGQFIATSHHPEAIRRFSAENTYILTRKSHLEPTRIRPLSEFTYHGDLINALIRDEVIG